jgi:flagellar basal-body rod protein FlgF
MDNAIYVGLSRQMTLRRELDIAANNMANVDTAGFKLEDLMLRPDPQARAKTSGVTSPVTFVMDDGVARDFGQGAVRATGGPLDLAIEGQGFFKVVTASGAERFTRDGRFKLDSDGKLITQDGAAVQGGGDIVLDATKGPVTISETGVISQAGQKVGQIDVVRFPDLSSLSKDGNNLFRNDTNVPPLPSTDAKLRQGALEGSNVQPIVQMTHLIDITRAYETITNLMSQTSDLSRRSIQRLGAIS